MDVVRKFFDDLDNVSGYPDEVGDAKCPFPIEPREFLDYAESDLKSAEPQAAANSLSNSKRALDSQLDFFFDAYGLSAVSTQKKWSTGRKIELIGDIGGVPKGILHRINQARNDLEHRFEPPSRMTAENAIDIVGLFIDATDFYLYPARQGNIFQNESAKRSLRLQLLPKEGLIWVGFKENDPDKNWDEWDIESEVIATESLPDYLYLLTFILHSNRLYSKNASRYFSRLKYVNQSAQNGN